MSRRSGLLPTILLVLLMSCGCIYVPIFPAARLTEVTVEESPWWFESNRIAIIEVDGFIGASDSGLLSWGGTTVADIKEKLDRAAKDGSVRVVVVRINSPGGEATASDMIHQELRRFREESGKPVVAHFMGLAASGGYYVGVAADHIVASPTTVTGSVGVIMQFINIEGLYGKIGLRSEVIKSGDKKDIGSPQRAMTEQERKLLQAIGRSLHERFVAAVREGRPAMSDEDFAAISDGRILTAQQAADLKMIDQIGYLPDALEQARRLAGIEHADVVLYRTRVTHNTNIYARTVGTPAPAVLEEALKVLLRRRGPMFLYLWSPGS